MKNLLLGFFLLMGFTIHAQAATWNVVDGELLGAGDISIAGLSGTYSVEFVEGTCVGIFNGCDNPADDFAFTTEADAIAAAQALLDQVFLDPASGGPDTFDTDPEKTFGCFGLSTCTAYIPWDIGTANEGIAWTVGARNGAGGSTGFNDNVIVDTALGDDEWDSSTLGPSVYAVFSAEIPVPGAVWLFGSALLGVFGVRKNKKSS